MKKRYQVFVSSTYKDLIDERQEVIHALLRADCIPAGMELFGAADEDQWTVIKKVIDESDFYVAIIAGKYGTEYRGKSYTQREYEYAVSKKKKVLALLYKNVDELPGSKLEKSEEKRKKLVNFRRLAQKKLCDFWTNKEELASTLYQSIEKQKQQNPRDGWIRATPYNLKKISENRNKKLITQNNKYKKNIDDLNSKIIKLNDKYKNGNENIQLKEELHKKIKEIDRKVNSFFPGPIHSPTIDSHVAFSSERLINSLMSMGMPINVALDVLELAVPEIIGLKRQASQLSTSHIRKAIANALYKVDNSDYGENEIQAWGDSYVRKYGNPEKRITIIYENEIGEIEIQPLSYRFLKKFLLPDLIKKINSELDYERFLKGSRKTEVNRISEEIMKQIKSLNIYRLHYETLLSLSKDLAMQPPHPWLVPKAFDFDIICFDYERAQFHSEKIRQMLYTKNISDGKYSIKECLHHSCSGILAIYGVYMGCGYLAPFHNLIYHAGQMLSKADIDVFEYSHFEKFHPDLNHFGVNLNNFYSELIDIRGSLLKFKESFDDTVSKTSENIVKVFNVFEKLYQMYNANNV